MPRIPDPIVNKLNSIPLTKVMEFNGYAPSRKTEKEYFYLCPFHPDTNESFKVDTAATLKPDGTRLYGFHCFGCGTRGWGALMLQALLMQKELKKDFHRVAEELCELAQLDLAEEEEKAAADALARLENLVVDGDHKNGFFHRAKPYAEPVDEICLMKKDGFTHGELRALGCQVQQVWRRDYTRPGVEYAVTGADGGPVYKYSFGPGFYTGSTQECNFDPRLLTERFNLYALSGFVTEKRRKGKDGEWRSYEVKSTSTYPVFAFVYQDEKGWWARKYEPLFKATEGGGNYKFTWWYEGGRHRDEEMSTRMYGDVDVMRALAGEPVETSDDAHPTVEVFQKEGGEKKRIRKFKRLVICSGPRDAMSVYFHSNAHVCFPHSERVDIPVSVVKRLREIACDIYVLYDADETGMEMANRLAMRFLDIKVVYLPRTLLNLRSDRTGRPCKDAEEYFNYFPPMLKGITTFYGNDINDHFANMLAAAKPMQFWDMKETRHAKNTDDEYVTRKYTMNVDNMNQFLSASGMCSYKDGEMFVDVGTDGIVDMVGKDMATNCAKHKMKDYLRNNRHYNTPELSNAISDTKRLNLSTLGEMPEKPLDFHAWGEAFDHLYYANTAVRVTPTEIACVPYHRMGYHVNREAILEAKFEPLDMSEYFEIRPHPTMKAIRRQYEADYYAAQTREEKAKLRRIFSADEKLWKYELVLKKPMEEMPPLLQFIYDLGRMYWREEEDGLELSPAKRQFQDAHFINKIIGLGYALARFRTPTRQHMVVITDYSRATTRVASGRNGKTTFAGLMRLSRKAPDNIPGKQFQKDATNFCRNFASFVQTVHSYIYIDDLAMGTNAELFYNITSQLSVRSMYHDTVTLPLEESPKIMVTMNDNFDVTSSSTYGRMWPMFVSDYYHDESLEGDVELRSPETKFGYDIVNAASEAEKMFNRNLMAYALQLYLRYAQEEKGALRPPMDGDAKLAAISPRFKVEGFSSWATAYFHKDNCWHFNQPIAEDELIISYMDYSGKEVTKEGITRVKRMFKEDLLLYCDAMNITVNPSVVRRKEGTVDQEKGKFRRVAWETVFMDGRPVAPRRRARGADSNNLPYCYYFYRSGTEPREFKEVGIAPMEDPEAEG